MDITMDAGALRAALGAVRGAVELRPNVPIMAGVRIEVDGGVVLFSAYDNTKAIQTPAVAEIADYGVMVVDHAKLTAAAALCEGSVRLAYLPKRQRVAVSAGKARHEIPCFDPADWPPMGWELEKAGDALIGEGEAWARALAVYSHVSPDFNRYGLNGLAVEVRDGEVRLVATDGSRLAWAEVPLTLPAGDAKAPRRMLLPVDAAKLAAKACAKGGLWALQFGDRAALWLPVDADGKPTPGVRMHFRLLEGEFPDYRLVLPPTHKRMVKVDTAALAAALQVVGLSAVDRNGTVDAHFEEARVLLIAVNPKGGESRAEVDAELDGAPLRTGFNGRLLAEGIGLLGAKEVWLRMGEALDPCIILPKECRGDVSGEPCGVVVMPMRLD